MGWGHASAQGRIWNTAIAAICVINAPGAPPRESRTFVQSLGRRREVEPDVADWMRRRISLPLSEFRDVLLQRTIASTKNLMKINTQMLESTYWLFAVGSCLSLTLANCELVHGVRGTLNIGSFSTIS
jgi:hypothetical protein